MAETNGNGSPDRLDRIERIIEVLANVTTDLQQDVKILLKAQVVMGDQMKEGFARLTAGMDELAAAQKHAYERIDELATAQKHADQRMDALILTVDEIVRGRKQP
jgi:hypothetical protein